MTSEPTMLAARVHCGEGLRLDTVSVPKLPNDDSMLVRIKCCAVCNGSDWLHIDDHLQPESKGPFTLGHEASGDVVEIGANVKGYALGDRVTFWCAIGSFAEYNVIRPAGLAMGKLPDDVTYEQGAVLQLVCAVLRGIESAEIGKGDKVLVLGQGPVGLLATQCALARGADLVVGLDMLPNSLEMAKTLGAKAAINAKDGDYVQRIREGVGDVNVVFDAMFNDHSPKKDTMDRSMTAMAKGGRYVLFGVSNEPRRFSTRTVYGRSLRIVTTETTQQRAQELMEEACALVADGTVDVTTFITHRFPLKQLHDALDLAFNHSDQCIKIVVNIPE